VIAKAPFGATLVFGRDPLAPGADRSLAGGEIVDAEAPKDPLLMLREKIELRSEFGVLLNARDAPEMRRGRRFGGLRTDRRHNGPTRELARGLVKVRARTACRRFCCDLNVGDRWFDPPTEDRNA
jgi:hypothetical protein